MKDLVYAERAPMKPWLVVGAGPCGVVGLGRVLSLATSAHWVDPAFECGKMSSWRDVPANTPVARIVEGLKRYPALGFQEAQPERTIKTCQCVAHAVGRYRTKPGA